MWRVHSLAHETWTIGVTYRKVLGGCFSTCFLKSLLKLEGNYSVVVVFAFREYELAVGMCVSPHPEPPTPHPPPPILQVATEPWHASDSAWLSVCTWWCICFSAILSNHPTLPSAEPRSLSLCLLCCSACRAISTLFQDALYMHQCMVFIFVLLTSLCIIGSRFIRLVRTDSHALLFISECDLSVCMCPYPFICGGIQLVSGVLRETLGSVSFSVLVSGYMPSSGIAGWCGSFIPSF